MAHTPLPVSDADALVARQIQKIRGGPEGNRWKDMVIDQLITYGIYSEAHNTDPRKAVKDLLDINSSWALDPEISSQALALIHQGRGDYEKLFNTAVTWCVVLATVNIIFAYFLIRGALS